MLALVAKAARAEAAKGAARARGKRVRDMRMTFCPVCPRCASPWTGDFKLWNMERRMCALSRVKPEARRAHGTPRGGKTRSHGSRSPKQTKPLRSHSLGGGLRSVVAKLLFQLLQREAGDRPNQMEQQAMTYLAQMDVPSSEAALFRARPRHAEPKKGRAWYGLFLCKRP